MVERLMKFRLIVVDRVDNPKCVVKKFVDIDETTVDIFDPSVVDIVERAICVASKLFPDAVDNVETDSCRLEKLEPATVDTKFILLFTYVITAFVPAVRELLILINSSPTIVEYVETAVKIPIVLKLEKTDPHITEIFDAFVELPFLSSVKVGV
jgi:hypothetical protein